MKHALFTFILFAAWVTVAAGQANDNPDFTHAAISIAIDSAKREIYGTVTYTFILDGPVPGLQLDAKNTEFTAVLLNGRKVKYTADSTGIRIDKALKKKGSYTLLLGYKARPVQTVYFVGWDDQIAGNNQIWTQGQGKYTSHWLPSFDDLNEKVEFDLRITFDRNYEVIANGALVGTYSSGATRTWQFNMDKPMSSYLLAFVIGRYDKKTVYASDDIPIELYYYPEDSLRVEPTYRHTRFMMDFFEKEIGLRYPWQVYKQIPVRDFLYAGMENTGATIFSDGFMIDSTAFMDKNYVNVNAHELAHQWFGNLVTAASGRDHWLHEGFATYYALLAEREIFGEEYFIWKLFESANNLNALALDEEGEALTDPGASSLTFYEKGALALHYLKEEVGEPAFRAGMQNFLRTFAYGNATIGDFLLVMEKESGRDLSNFKRLWLNNTHFPFPEVKQDLAKASESLALFLELQREMTTSSEANDSILRRYWDRSSNTFLRRHMLLRYHKLFPEAMIGEALQTGIPEIRQAIVAKEGRVPAGLKDDFETLLGDKSYITVELALYRLWLLFPADRMKYLYATRDIEGLPNKNVRLLWLTLALLTRDISAEIKRDYLRELRSYTSPAYSFEVRQAAFQFLSETFELTAQNLKDLVNATGHPVWQFRQFSRKLLDQQLKKESVRTLITDLSEELNETEKRYINNKLKPE